MGSDEAMIELPPVRMADLLPGDIMFGPIGGFIPGVLPVGIGQVLLAGEDKRLTWRKWWEIRHVGMVVSTRRFAAPDLVQAMPGGAERIEMSEAKHWTLRHVYIRPAWYPGMELDVDTSFTQQGTEAAQVAIGYVGTPYNFLTYAKLAASYLRLPISRRVLERWISTRRDMMCSQLVDQALADAGYHVFDDGRLPQDVTPADLYLGLLTLPGRWCIPGLTRWLPNRKHPIFV